MTNLYQAIKQLDEEIKATEEVLNDETKDLAAGNRKGLEGGLEIAKAERKQLMEILLAK